MARPLTPAQRSELGPKCYSLSLEGRSNRSIGEQLGINRATVARLLGEEARQRRKELTREHGAVFLLDRCRRAQEEAYRRLAAIRPDSASPAVSGTLHALIAALRLELDLTGLKPPDRRVVQHLRDRGDYSNLSDQELDTLVTLWEKVYPGEGGQLLGDDENALVVHELEEGGDG